METGDFDARYLFGEIGILTNERVIEVIEYDIPSGPLDAFYPMFLRNLVDNLTPFRDALSVTQADREIDRCIVRNLVSGNVTGLYCGDIKGIGIAMLITKMFTELMKRIDQFLGSVLS